MQKNDLHPPANGPGSDPVLYGVAAGLAQLFPPVRDRARPEVVDENRAKAPKPPPRRD